tara:strand:+ start:950 stop:1189 length:240 start_codon:yes stop_codon:yes gene_type:complete
MTDKIKIEPPNESGATPCIIRWQCDMRDGLWIGAWEQKAFAEFERLIRADEREQCAQICDEVRPSAHPPHIAELIRGKK